MTPTVEPWVLLFTQMRKAQEDDLEKSRVVFWISLRQAMGGMEQVIGNGVWTKTWI